MPTPIDKRSLLRYVMPDREAQDEQRVALCVLPRAGRPEPWGVLYSEPNPDQSRKACGNCTFWVASGECDIHAPGVQVAGYAVCGYHVYGQPLTARTTRQQISYLKPEYSGLATVPGGTSCGECKWFDASVVGQGLCLAVDGPEGEPVSVEVNACCARWESHEKQ